MGETTPFWRLRVAALFMQNVRNPFFVLFVHIDTYRKLMYNKIYICNF